MKCPVVRVIDDLYSTGRYNGSGDVDDAEAGPPSDILFYITRRKIEFARAQLGENNLIAEATISVYHERMFRDYIGKTSKEMFNNLFKDICVSSCNRFAQTVDILIIMENVCEKELSIKTPDNMSLPQISFDENAICNIESDPAKITTEVNNLINYANKLCVGGIKTKIEPLGIFADNLREFTFTGDPEALLKLDMEVAEYAYELEKYHHEASKKMQSIIDLCQQVIDLSK